MDERRHPTSNIPRLSRLPVRTSLAGVQRPEKLTGERGLAVDGVDPLKKSRLGPTAEKSTPNGRPEQQRDSFVKPPPKQISVRQRGPAGRNVPADGVSEQPDQQNSNFGIMAPKIRKPRPSLSDRAIETLSQIPASPSPRRRQSGFFPSDSPALRPPSSLGRNRPTTSTGFYPPLPTSRPASPSKRLNTLHRGQGQSWTPSKSTFPQRPSSRLQGRDQETPSRQARVAAQVSKAVPSKTKPSAEQTAVPQIHKDRDSGLVRPSSTLPYPKPNSKSSAALRETIANARAARQAVPKYEAEQVLKPITRYVDSPGPQADLVHTNPLRKRINTARSDGRLNISGMGLKVLPVEVLKMYELDSITDGPAWYECVDLIGLDASNNELESFGWEVVDDTIEKEEDQPPGSIFSGLQTLNLLGNRLQTISSELRDLRHLTVLNLSRNRLEQPIDDVFRTISHISSLRKLYLAESGLSGPLPPFARCWELEILDLHGNLLTGLPEELSKCSRLRELDVSDNRISQLPSIYLPNLTTLSVSSNQIEVESLVSNLTAPRLVDLDISMCRIGRLPDLRSRFPCLTTLTAFGNRISMLDVESVRGLEVLDLKNNDLISLPPELSLIGLKRFIVSGNPMRAPRREILEGTTERLMDWLRGRLPAGILDEETF
ncbi:MAG: hypothetical protein L6R39_006032 [Caloplaca ligustica]|nr:MAG: hypothetical protein L6R39_006032 [Caloplaca ligustica]